MRYRRKSPEVEATCWTLPDDHTAVVYYDPPGKPEHRCVECGNHDYTHGWIKDESHPAGGHRVCSGDWVVETADSTLPMKPDAFHALYERCPNGRR